ncbi:hypothetical protein SUGI_0478830 [Cryptomeria japonica]|nr:hypothetical protein SUGI_0478830 [Cryptomeria japonica]
MEQEEEYGLDEDEFVLSSKETSNDIDLEDLSQSKELPFCCAKELEADKSIEHLLKEVVSLFAHLPSFIEEENIDLECTSLGNNGDVEHGLVVSKSLLRDDRFDELLGTLVEEDDPLTMEEESTWQVIMQGLARTESAIISNPRQRIRHSRWERW